MTGDALKEFEAVAAMEVGTVFECGSLNPNLLPDEKIVWEIVEQYVDKGITKLKATWMGAALGSFLFSKKDGVYRAL